ncbi:hypothetical protein N7461_004431 [Penicillium sp. DV-2018c]|nr:hypothetical protein N7461_004431 [Penicillium sp. DV-2018c]
MWGTRRYGSGPPEGGRSWTTRSSIAGKSQKSNLRFAERAAHQEHLHTSRSAAQGPQYAPEREALLETTRRAFSKGSAFT